MNSQLFTARKNEVENRKKILLVVIAITAILVKRENLKFEKIQHVIKDFLCRRNDEC